MRPTHNFVLFPAFKKNDNSNAFTTENVAFWYERHLVSNNFTNNIQLSVSNFKL